MTLSFVDLVRLQECSDFPAVAGPRSDRRDCPAAIVTALRAVGRRAGSFLPGLGAGRDLLQPRPLHFRENEHPDGRHLRGPP